MNLPANQLAGPEKCWFYWAFARVAHTLAARGGPLANQLADLGFAHPGTTDAIVVQRGVNGNENAS
jgi:hypothetical protein